MTLTRMAPDVARLALRQIGLTETLGLLAYVEGFGLVVGSLGVVVEPTRLVRDSDDNDWRNAAQFLFDLAMLAGGLTQAARAVLIAPLAKRMNALAGAFDDFVADPPARTCSACACSAATGAGAHPSGKSFT